MQSVRRTVGGYLRAATDFCAIDLANCTLVLFASQRCLNLGNHQLTPAISHTRSNSRKEGAQGLHRFAGRCILTRLVGTLSAGVACSEQPASGASLPRGL